MKNNSLISFFVRKPKVEGSSSGNIWRKFIHYDNDQEFNKMPDKFSSRFRHYFVAAFIIGFAALLCSPLSDTPGYQVVSFILLFVVSFLATFLGIGPVFFAATLGAICWNYFFIPPHFTFHIDKLEDLLMLCMFFIIAILNGILTTRIRKQQRLALEREKRTNILFALTKELSKTRGLKDIVKITAEQIRNNFAAESMVLLQDGKGQLELTYSQNGLKTAPDYADAAVWVFKNGKDAGRFTSRFPDCPYTFYPLTGTLFNSGVIGLLQERPLPADLRNFRDTFLAQITNALEREFLAEMAEKARFLDESDRLYKALFNSISHEFRIPVATIMGASDTLLNAPNSKDIQEALYNEIFTASKRLNRLIENLLNISRLESGRLSVQLNWCDINDLINQVYEELSDDLKPFSFLADVPDDMPLVRIDFGLMGQVLYNLLFNSCEHSPASSVIRISVSCQDSMLNIRIADRGPGFPPDKISRVFDKFFRIGDKTGGLGLGLSIVKGFVEAHKGTITVRNRKKGGAEFSIFIPTKIPDMSNLTSETNE